MSVNIVIKTPSGMSVVNECSKFPGGEMHVRIGYTDARWFHITAHLSSTDAIMELFLTTDALRQRTYYDASIHLVMPYVPYARQDRVCNEGEAVSARVFCDLINQQKYDSVTIWDPHSDVVPACLDRCRIVPVETMVTQVPLSSNCIFVAPDSGALKKVAKCAKKFNRAIIRADKIRDIQNGDILETKVYAQSLGSTDVLIIDDIADGGATFIELAKELRKLTTGGIGLYVTHGIFSRGFEPFMGIIDDIYTANPFLPSIRLARQPTNTLWHYQPSLSTGEWI